MDDDGRVMTTSRWTPCKIRKAQTTRREVYARFDWMKIAHPPWNYISGIPWIQIRGFLFWVQTWHFFTLTICLVSKMMLAFWNNVIIASVRKKVFPACFSCSFRIIRNDLSIKNREQYAIKKYCRHSSNW